MGEFSETFKRYRSRIGLRDATTAITSASIVIVLALIAFAFQSNPDDDAGRISDQAAELADSGTLDSPLTPGDVEPGKTSGPLTPSTTGGAPGAAAPGAPTAPSEVPKDVAITNEVVKVGVAYLTDPGSANAAAGFAGIGQVDQKRAIDAMIAEVNRVRPYGRKLVPVYYSASTDDVTSKGAERIEQEMCARWTQDNKVFMVWSSGLDTLKQCLKKAKVAQIGGGGGFSWRQTYRDYPYLVEPSSSALDRMAEFEVDQLVKQNFFKEFKDNQPPYTPLKPADGKARIGLIRYDQPSYDAAAAAMKGRLAKYGLSLCDGCEFKIAYSSDSIPEQLDDATEVNAAIQNCKSRPDGPCTHMLFLGSTAGVRITLFFVDGAEKQAYRPRLGFNPLDAPTAVADFLGPSSHPQFADSLLVTDNPGDFNVRTPAFKRCKKLFEDAGEDFSGDEAANKEDQIGGYCDTAWYHIATMQKAGPNLTLSSWLNAVEHIAPVDSATAYLMQTKVGRHDGSGAVRVGAWDGDCACYKPKTGIIPV